jgi:hypothetical protein
MAITLKIMFQKPGYPIMMKAVEIPIKFTDNPDIMRLVESGYYYYHTEVKDNPS